MPEFRKDPLSGRWVIIAEERLGRPNQYSAGDGLACPFCPGNESQTPDEIDVFRPKRKQAAPNSSEWAVRVVPNKFPAVQRNENIPDYRSFKSKFGGMLDVEAPLSHIDDPKVAPLPGIGTHEVIIDAARHVLSISELSNEENNEMFRMYRKRLRAIRREKKWMHALIFKNVGEAAGASIEHTHTQLMAMPFLPPPVQRELLRLIQFRRRTELCYWCAHIDFELNSKTRVIEETKRFVAICPYLSRFPLEVSVIPKKHISHLENFDDSEISELAGLVRHCVKLLEKVVTWMPGPLAYNMIVHSGPFVYSGPTDAMTVSDTSPWFRTLDYSFENAYHFRLTLMPSLAKAAGFEWGCGLHINPISPETATAKLREISRFC